MECAPLSAAPYNVKMQPMDRQPRLKSDLRVAAILRRAGAAGAGAHVARKGDGDAGTIALKIYLGRDNGVPLARLVMEARPDGENAVWRDVFDIPQAEHLVDERLARETKFDRDLWIIEIEDRAGRTFAD